MSSTSKTNKHVAILGSGILGLTSAYVLVERGYDVTIIARDMAWDTTSQHFASPWAGANWFTFANEEGRESRWDAITFRRWLQFKENGVLPAEVLSMMPFTHIGPVHRREDIWFSDLVRNLKISEDGREMRFESFTISVPLYTAWLVEELRGSGVKFVRVPTLLSIGSVVNVVGGVEVIVHASGLGARWISEVKDEGVEAIRGQTVLVHAPGVRRCVMQLGPSSLYIIPRAQSGQVILGGTFDRNNSDLRPDAETSRRIIQGCTSLVPELIQPDGSVHILSHNVGLRPARSPSARVEADNPLLINGRSVGLIHAYGIGPAGYQASFGIATDVADLVDSHFVSAHL